jgi:hypothetical protein
MYPVTESRYLSISPTSAYVIAFTAKRSIPIDIPIDRAPMTPLNPRPTTSLHHTPSPCSGFPFTSMLRLPLPALPYPSFFDFQCIPASYRLLNRSMRFPMRKLFTLLPDSKNTIVSCKRAGARSESRRCFTDCMLQSGS